MVLWLALSRSFLAACGYNAVLPESAAIGPNPTLPAPIQTLILTVDIAPAKRLACRRIRKKCDVPNRRKFKRRFGRTKA
jgi:hypothetical protein